MEKIKKMLTSIKYKNNLIGLNSKSSLPFYFLAFIAGLVKWHIAVKPVQIILHLQQKQAKKMSLLGKSVMLANLTVSLMFLK